MMIPYAIASVSWGKDSLAMLRKLIIHRRPLDEVVFFDTGMEFQAIYDERDKTLPLLKLHGIKYTELKPKNTFEYNMFERPVKSRKTGEVHKYGYGWCGGPCRWGTTEKLRALDRYAEAIKKRKGEVIVYIGIAFDEHHRIIKERKEYKQMPLVDWGWTEADCLAYCYQQGHQWREGDARLYDHLDRVSCWCCRNKNMRELKAIHDHFPDYWQRLLELEERLGPMKSKPLSVIGGE